MDDVGTAAVAYLASLRIRAFPSLVAGLLRRVPARAGALAGDECARRCSERRPDGGGRFYGIGNQVETLLLPGAARGRCGRRPARGSLPIGAARARHRRLEQGGSRRRRPDRLRRRARRPRAAAQAGAADAGAARRRRGAVVGLALALIGIDAALGGSSHVTHAVGGGPGSLLGDLGHRLHLSWASATQSSYPIVALPRSRWLALVWIAHEDAAASRGRRDARRARRLAARQRHARRRDRPGRARLLGSAARFESVDSRRMRGEL